MKKEVVQSIVIVTSVIIVGLLFAWRYLLSPGVTWQPPRQTVTSAPEAAPAGPGPLLPQGSGDDVATLDAPQASAPDTPPGGVNILKNAWFEDGLDHWNYWRSGKDYTQSIRVVEATLSGTQTKALRIENPYKMLLGVQQLAAVKAGDIYRLTARVRSVATNDSKVIFGGRAAVWLPEKREREMVWMSEYDKWWKKDMIFTAGMDGAAVVLLHMGYGTVGSTGEFTGISLERIGP